MLFRSLIFTVWLTGVTARRVKASGARKLVHSHKNATQSGDDRIVLFLLSPLTSLAVEEIKRSVNARLQQGARSVEIYTMSDTLRCGSESLVGGQLPSQVAGCNTLLGSPMKAEYANLFGDQFNQVWATAEWGDLMRFFKMLPETSVGAAVSIFLYPTQLFKNPTMDKVLETLVDPKEFKKANYDSNFGPLLRYWLNWCNAKKGAREAVFDLGPVMDFVLWEKKEPSLRSMAQEVEWCVAEQPNRFTETPMVYVDIKGKDFSNHCAKATAKVTEGVKIAVPTEKSFYENWAEKFRESLHQAMVYQPGHEHGAHWVLDEAREIYIKKSREVGIIDDVHAIIVQDSLDADNPISVLWLLKNVQFQSVNMISVSQSVNLKTHKGLFNGLIPPLLGRQKPGSFLMRTAAIWLKDANDPSAGYTSKGLKPTIPLLSEIEEYDNDGLCSACTGKPFAWPYLNAAAVGDVYKEYANNNKHVAWPQLLDPSGKPLKQVAVDDVDSELMEMHNMWRWKEWFKRFSIPNVRLVSGGYTKYCIMSQSIVPYTNYFFNKDADTKDMNFVVDYPRYAELETAQSTQAEIRSNLCGMVNSNLRKFVKVC